MAERQADKCARVEDVHDLALGMPHVTVEYGTQGNPVHQVGRKSFVFFRTPRPDAVDPLSQASARRAAAWLDAHPPVDRR